MSSTSLSLIVRLPNWVGDVVMALPSLQALHSLGITVHLFGKPWAEHLLRATGMNFFNLESGFLANTKKMTAIPSEYTLLLTNSFSSALIAYLARKKSIGYKQDARQMLLTASLVKAANQHEVQYFWELARFAYSHWFANMPWPEPIPNKIVLPLHSESILKAKNALAEANITQDFWVLCPFAQGTNKKGQSKVWPFWRELSQHLNQPLVVCPNKNEESLCADLVPNATVLKGLNLSEYAAVLSLAKQVVANDSGPMHMAAAVGVNTLGIFGATCPKRTHPWGSNYIGSADCWPSTAEVLNKLPKT